MPLAISQHPDNDILEELSIDATDTVRYELERRLGHVRSTARAERRPRRTSDAKLPFRARAAWLGSAATNGAAAWRASSSCLTSTISSSRTVVEPAFIFKRCDRSHVDSNLPAAVRHTPAARRAASGRV